MKKIIIQTDLCKGCRRCVAVCPLGLILVSERINAMNLPVIEVKNPHLCCGCGRCYYSCPEPEAILIVEEMAVNDAN
ncbi:MAG: 4Fe-4S binding protein [Victivallaceae bacterium]